MSRTDRTGGMTIERNRLTVQNIGITRERRKAAGTKKVVEGITGRSRTIQNAEAPPMAGLR
jgi:hypothetical protein